MSGPPRPDPVATPLRPPRTSTAADKLARMNPRYRRMVIPGALVGLILIVIVSALVRG
jgi:hypothetical protein